MNTKGWIALLGLGGLLWVNPPLPKWVDEVFEEFNRQYSAGSLRRAQLLQLEEEQARRGEIKNREIELYMIEFNKQFPAAWTAQNSAALPQQYMPPVDEVLAQLTVHPSVILILGHRGSGKTALAVRYQELRRDVAAPYAVGLPQKAKGLLPEWYGMVQDFGTIPKDAIIYIPESYRFFHARDTSSARGRSVAELVNLSRHRRHTLIFDVQNAAQLDRNIISEADLVLVKEPGPFQEGFERSQFQGLMDQARAAFSGLGKGRKKQAVWVVAPGVGIKGKLMENRLPTFWSEALSRVFCDASVSLSGGQMIDTDNGKAAAAGELRPGKRTPTGVKRDKARQMRAGGYSYGEIASALGCSRSYAHKLVNGPE